MNRRSRSISMALGLPLVWAMLAWTFLPVSAQESITAVADLIDRDEKYVGRAVLRETADGVQLTVQVQGATGIAPGEHGIHLHQKASCVAPTFDSAGPHHNPLGDSHGLNNPAGPHAGDLPNIVMNADGSSTPYETVSTLITLRESDRTLFDADGSALVIHANPDDQVTDPSGNSGARILCGVVINENIVIGMPSTGNGFEAGFWLASVGALIAMVGGLLLKGRTPKENDAAVREIDWR
jgi:superoxide dismutase, Cu-Zn family